MDMMRVSEQVVQQLHINLLVVGTQIFTEEKFIARCVNRIFHVVS